MKYAVCIVPVSAVRIGPDHRMEMTSQYLFGETGEVLNKTPDGWIYLQDSWDQYKGWCRSNQFVLTDDHIGTDKKYTADWLNEINLNGRMIKIPFGCSLSLQDQSLPELKVKYEGNFADAGNTVTTPENILRYSEMFLDTAYLWGGKSVFGIDCSGFVQSVFKMMNVPLQRDANLQVGQGSAVGFLQESVCGDLAFFDDEHGDIVHVGILLSPQEIIHASGNVRKDRIDNQGIVHADTGLRTHRLRTIKRIF